jgi:hypothetical protein
MYGSSASTAVELQQVEGDEGGGVGMGGPVGRASGGQAAGDGVEVGAAMAEHDDLPI